MKLLAGDVFHESEVMADRVTGRFTRRLTQSGLYNNTPTYHLNTAFSADGSLLALTSEHEDGTALLAAEVETGSLRVLAAAPAGSGIAYTSGSIAMLQKAGKIAAATGPDIRLYDVCSSEEQILYELDDPAMQFAHPIGSPDGTKLYVPRIPRHPDLTRGMDRPVRSYNQACLEDLGGIGAVHLEIDLSDGSCREVFREETFGCSHIQPCPADPRILLIDRDAPPDFARGSDGGRTSRVWTLNLADGSLTEIRPRDPNRFQIHSNWSADGQHIFYHGRCMDGGAPVGKPGGWHYIGAASRDGSIVWEQRFPHFHYGHVSSHAGKNALIIDSLLTPNLVLAIHYEEPHEHVPPIEVLCEHGSMVNKIKGQISHPHCHVSRDGRWLAYNRGGEDRADVYVVRLE